MYQESSTADALADSRSTRQDILKHSRAETPPLVFGVDGQARQERHRLRVAAGTSRQALGCDRQAELTRTFAKLGYPVATAKSRKFWPGTSPAALTLPSPSPAKPLSSLKQFEDALDALVCVWIGTRYLSGRIQPYGDHTAAVWCPEP